MYDPSLGPTPSLASQIHDLNPGITPPGPDGLFWTTVIPDEGIEVHLGEGVASMQATNVHIDDYGNVLNALFGGGPTPIPGVVSLAQTHKDSAGEPLARGGQRRKG